MPNIPLSFDKGRVTARDTSMLIPGELSVATGCEYRIGSPHIYKLPGRAVRGNALVYPVLNLGYLQYDTANSVLVACAGGNLFESAVSTSPTFGASVASVYPTAIPTFTGFNDQWIMCNAVDRALLREPSGTWRSLAFVPPAVPPTIEGNSDAGTSVDPTPVAGDFNNTDNLATVAASATINSVTTLTQIWVFNSDAPVLLSNPRYLRISHRVDKSGASSFSQESGGSASHMRTSLTISVSENYDTNQDWTELVTRTNGYSTVSSEYQIESTDNLSGKLAVKVELSASVVVGDSWATAYISSLQFDNGASAASKTIATNLTYLFCEVYYDSDDQRHESKGSRLSTELTGGPYYAVTLTLPSTPQNSICTHYAVYRSIDATGEGYPNMWRIAEFPITDTYIDPLSGDITLVDPLRDIYPTIDITYPDGSSVNFAVNNFPDITISLAVQFQGSIVYMPVNDRQLWYSVPPVLGDTGAEQVPAPYNLRFSGPQNDQLRSICLANKGLTLLAYFETYTQYVNYLPQVGDTQFDSRVKEYVSKQRGAAGRLCTCEFDLGTGQTAAASVDALGLWITDGTSFVHDWSQDMDWETDMAGVNLANVRLVNNPEMRRLEMMFVQNSRYREFHFFYGRLKEGNLPLITGPHPSTVSRLYLPINNSWEGLSGDASGNVHLERSGNADDAKSYDGVNKYIPFKVTTGATYFAGLGRAFIVEFGYPKFASGVAITLTDDANHNQGVVGTFTRDGGTTRTIIKNWATDQRKVYWHQYADRHSIEVRNISTSSMPALVGYEFELRDGGVGRDT